MALRSQNGEVCARVLRLSRLSVYKPRVADPEANGKLSTHE
jgi:hypothetical protein